MNPTRHEQLDKLSDFLGSRREAILVAWRKAATADPQQTTGRSLSRRQFNDHIPEVLDSFERKLCAGQHGAGAEAAADAATKKEEVKHGLHRWQQGYRLQEVMQEWGHLQLCLFDELGAYAAAHPEITLETMQNVHRQVMTLVIEAIGESTGQYERMQKAEAAGRLNDVEITLASLNEIERRRASLIQEAVHDLGGNVLGVSVAAKLLGRSNIAELDRVEFAKLLHLGMASVTEMLGDLKVLSRLEAGRETRQLSRLSVPALITELSDANRPLADARGLFLKTDGPRRLSVEGDSKKIRRLIQNLLLNALKYTEHGGVSLSWGAEKESWWVSVKDTGPGLLAGPGAPMVVGLEEATASVRMADGEPAAPEDEADDGSQPTPTQAKSAKPTHQQPGEGIGLSIVKRLCELLDASLEMAGTAGTGTTFRVVLPRRYQSAPRRKPADKSKRPPRRAELVSAA